MWKQVKNFEGLYEVNEMGQIRSVQRNGTKRGGRIMAQSNDKNGYKLSKLRFKDKVVTAKVHRVVAEAFIPNPYNKPQVNHKDGNKANNCVENLEWVTQSENIRHAKKLGLQCECPNRQKVEQWKNGSLIAKYNSLKEAEIATGIGWTGISAVIRGKRHTAGGYNWKRCND